MRRILAILVLMLGLGSAAAQESTPHASVPS